MPRCSIDRFVRQLPSAARIFTYFWAKAQRVGRSSIMMPAAQAAHPRQTHSCSTSLRLASRHERATG